MCSSLLTTPAGVDLRTPVAESLRALAPLQLPNLRQARSFGDELCVPLAGLAKRDQNLLRSLYEQLTALLYAIVATSTDDAWKWQEVALWADRRRLDAFITAVRELGSASHAQSSGGPLAKAMHDVRGGALCWAACNCSGVCPRLPRNSASSSCWCGITSRSCAAPSRAWTMPAATRIASPSATT